MSNSVYFHFPVITDCPSDCTDFKATISMGMSPVDSKVQSCYPIPGYGDHHQLTGRTSLEYIPTAYFSSPKPTLKPTKILQSETGGCVGGVANDKAPTLKTEPNVNNSNGGTSNNNSTNNKSNSNNTNNSNSNSSISSNSNSRSHDQGVMTNVKTEMMRPNSTNSTGTTTGSSTLLACKSPISTSVQSSSAPTSSTTSTANFRQLNAVTASTPSSVYDHYMSHDSNSSSVSSVDPLAQQQGSHLQPLPPTGPGQHLQPPPPPPPLPPPPSHYGALLEESARMQHRPTYDPSPMSGSADDLYHREQARYQSLSAANINRPVAAYSTAGYDVAGHRPYDPGSGYERYETPQQACQPCQPQPQRYPTEYMDQEMTPYDHHHHHHHLNNVIKSDLSQNSDSTETPLYPR